MREINSLVMYYDWWILVEPFSLEDKGRFFEAIYKHATVNYSGEDLPEPVKSVFIFVAKQLDKDKLKYIAKCEKNEENARKRYEKRQKEEENGKKPKKVKGASYDIEAFEKSLDED